MNNLFNDMFKNSKSVQNIIDLNTGLFTEALNKSVKDFSEMMDTTVSAMKSYSEVKTPENFVEAQMNNGKTISAKVQKITEENINWVKSAGSKYGEAFEGFYNESKKAAK